MKRFTTLCTVMVFSVFALQAGTVLAKGNSGGGSNKGSSMHGSGSSSKHCDHDCKSGDKGCKPSWNRKFLGYTFTTHIQPKLKVAVQSVLRLKSRLRELFRVGRGRSLGRVIEQLRPKLIGWVSYFRKSEVRIAFEELDQWIRRKLRAILWRQWKRNWTRARELERRGLTHERAWASATNGRGPWWNAGASHMNQAVPIRYLRQLGLPSLIQELRRLVHSI